MILTTLLFIPGWFLIVICLSIFGLCLFGELNQGPSAQESFFFDELGPGALYVLLLSCPFLYPLFDFPLILLSFLGLLAVHWGCVPMTHEKQDFDP